MNDYTLDIRDKVCVITGAGGVLCSMFAKTLAEQGAKVALLDLNEEAAEGFAKEIRDAGYVAKAYQANVLEKESLQVVHQKILADLGSCDILINGAGGNNARANTTNEYYRVGDEEKEDIVSFFDLDESGVQFVFNLNFIGTLLPTQEFARDMVEKKAGNIINISSCSMTRTRKTTSFAHS